jgi:hypothetical protein
MTRRDTAIASAYRFLRLRAERADDLPPPPPPAPPPPPPPRPAWQPRHERMPISPKQIEQLRRRALADGDQFFARVCERALRGNSDACKAAVYGLA